MTFIFGTALVALLMAGQPPLDDAAASTIEDSGAWLYEHPHARWALISQDGRSMDGGEDSGARARAFATQARGGDFIWFSRLSKEYLIDDPGTINQVAEWLDAQLEAWREIDELGTKKSEEMSALFRQKYVTANASQKAAIAQRLDVLANEQDQLMERRHTVDDEVEEKLHRLFDQTVDDGRAKLVHIEP